MKRRILVVDDEPDIRELLREVLGNHGHDVVTADTAMSGLNEARRYLPDLVLLDVMLGDMDGFSVCEILHTQPSTHGIPVIMMTAMAGEMARFNSFASGALGFISKPLSPRDLLARVDSFLAPKTAPPERSEAPNARAAPSPAQHTAPPGDFASAP